MRKHIPQTENFKGFIELVEAAETKYTLPFKEACKYLKCSRSWVQKYIRPNVPSIYLSNGKGTSSVNYARMVTSIISQKKITKMATVMNLYILMKPHFTVL